MDEYKSFQVTITKKFCTDLSKNDCDTMNTWRKQEFGENAIKNFKQDYPQDSMFFFVKSEEVDEIYAFGALMPIEIEFQNQKYHIFGFCNIISIVKNKGFGKKLILSMIQCLEEQNITALGFCPSKTSKFYEKCNLAIKNDFIKRFQYRKPTNIVDKNGNITYEIVIDNDGDGIYFEGKDKFITAVLNQPKEIVFIDIPFW